MVGRCLIHCPSRYEESHGWDTSWKWICVLLYSTSTHHKINTKSSTKAELMAVNDVMPLILWTWYLLEAQGYEVHENKVFQDNQRAMLLEKNGKHSSSHRMCHINICYFFVIDPIQLRKWPLNIAQLAKCWLTCLPSPYKVPPSIISVPLFWISQTMMRFVRPWCPWQATGVCGETSQQRMTTDRPASQSSGKEASRWRTWSNGWPRIM